MRAPKEPLLFTICCVLQLAKTLSLLNEPIQFADSADYEEMAERCQHSKEASKFKLFEFFKKVKRIYYELHPHMIGTHLEINEASVKKLFRPMNINPDHLRQVSLQAGKLLEELQDLGVSHSSLKPRESRLYHQFQYFLRQSFDSPYQGYFDGVWMLGPDYFCEQPICFINSHLAAALRRITPNDVDDLELIIKWIRMHAETFNQYLKNVKQGAKRGMVFPKEVCKSAAKTFRQSYMSVGRHGAEGALKMTFAKIILDQDYYANINRRIQTQYFTKFKKDYFDDLNRTIVENVGKPLHRLMVYLQGDHQDYCVPSNISSGLSNLPLQYIYKDGKTIGKSNPKLPTGEDIDAAAGYQRMLSYYTTTNVTGSEAMDLGYSLVSHFYDQAVDLAKELTGENDKDKAIDKFKKKLQLNKYFYNEEEFPEEESSDEAHTKCDDDEEAKRNCPKRWAALQRWFKETADIMREAKPAIKHLFHFDGAKKTVPDCMIKLTADYNPTSGVPSYLESDEDCEEPASYFIPFFKDRMGPKYEDYNTNFHEARPGHHLQIQGFLENFGDHCDSVSTWINELVDYYPAFSEGWGVYCESPILVNDTNLLEKQDRMQTYGQIKWQIWRALRLIVDVGMHAKNMSREEALDLFHKYTWDESDTASKEITRYQGNPGQATSYMIGQQTLVSFRNRAKVRLGDKFDIRDFHYHVLSQGQAPFDFLSNYIDGYIECERDKKDDDKKKDTDFCKNLHFRYAKKHRTAHQRLMSQVFHLFRRRVHM